MGSSLVRRVGTAAGLTGFAVILRWTTAGTVDRASTADLESMAALVFAGVAWTAYVWLAVAIVATLLGQLPGALGRAASAVAVGITSDMSRRLLRSVLGVAAAAPFTVGVAHAMPIASNGNAAPQVLRLDNPPQPVGHAQIAPRAGSVQRGWAVIEHPSTVALAWPQHDRRTLGRPADPPRPRDLIPVERASSVDMTGSPDNTTGVESTGLEDRAVAARDWAPVERASTVDLVASVSRNNGRIPIPDRPTVGTPTRYTDVPPNERTKPQPSTRSPIRVTVRRGDTLWTIAARELGPSATSAAIARRWPQWYATNARVIGTDPDLLLPGQTLRAPRQSRTEHPLPNSRINQEN